MKLLLLLFTTLSFSLTVLAQNFSGGFVLGATTSQIDGDQYPGFHKWGSTFGGFVNYRFSRHVSIQPEILFEEIGSKATQEQARQSRRPPIHVNIRTLNLPLLLYIYYPIDFGGSQLATEIYLGGSAGVQLGGLDFTGNNPELGQLNRYDYRLMIGASLPITDRIAINGRFTYSLAPAMETEVEVPAPFNETQTRTLLWYYNYLSFSVRFHLVKDDREY